MLRDENVSGISASHYSLRQVQTSTSEIGSTSNIDNSTDWPAVNSHAKWQPQIIFDRSAQFHSTTDWRFRAAVKDQGHAVTGGDFDQALRCFGFSKLLCCPDDVGQLIESGVLFVNGEF